MKSEFQAAIDDPENPVLDINAAGNDVLSILVRDETGTRFVSGSTENVMLHIYGMDDFLAGERGAVLSSDPHLSVRKTNGDSVYRIQYKDRAVESMPSQADDVLKALRVAKEEHDADPLMEVYREIVNSQVRRDVMNDLLNALPNLDEDRIEITEQGWLIDQFYVVDWTASLYVDNDSGETFSRNFGSGDNQITTLDKSKEFVELRPKTSPEPTKIKLDGESIVLGEREMTFLSKVQWVLRRVEYHPDRPFWMYNESYRKKHIRGEL